MLLHGGFHLTLHRCTGEKWEPFPPRGVPDAHRYPVAVTVTPQSEHLPLHLCDAVTDTASVTYVTVGPPPDGGGQNMTTPAFQGPTRTCRRCQTEHSPLGPDRSALSSRPRCTNESPSKKYARFAMGQWPSWLVCSTDHVQPDLAGFPPVEFYARCVGSPAHLYPV